MHSQYLDPGHCSPSHGCLVQEELIRLVYPFPEQQELPSVVPKTYSFLS